MNKKKMLSNRAFTEVYEASSSRSGFPKGTLFGRVSEKMIWTAVPNTTGMNVGVATGRILPYEENLFEGKNFTKLRGPQTSPNPRKRWWTEDSTEKPKPLTYSKKFHQQARFTSPVE